MHYDRRQFLRSAGGITFLALRPIGRGLFAAVSPSRAMLPPVFTAVPYIQPGIGGRLVAGRESSVLVWQTNAMPADFAVRYGPDRAYGRRATIARRRRLANGSKDLEGCFNYAATLEGLELATRYRYEVRCEGAVIAEGFFTTRAPRGRPTRFVAFGDNAFGEAGERAVAYQAYLAGPDFVMNTGDNVYESGLDHEYARHFFPVYNADVANPGIGAPLLRSVPFYSVLANHDVHAKDLAGHPTADFDQAADSLGYYTNFHLPGNGPAPGQPTPIRGVPARLDGFKTCAGDRYPAMANYSYDWGDAHFLCLDSNTYVDPADPALGRWIERDLAGTDASWKFVVYHHPAFNVGREHYTEQQFRLLTPLFERHGVDFVLSGHEHNYQRSRPLRFLPAGPGQGRVLGSTHRLVPGRFAIDRAFDGRSRTRPDGIIHIVTGAGGKSLYDRDLAGRRENWLHPEDDRADYVDRFVADRHSLTLFEIAPEKVLLRQIDQSGGEVDRIAVTKA